uniref:Ovule protein n=1 Tax=Ascaris lumbricoides TaxID=6252 RepID=A0A0M3HM77_ASCLU
MAILVKGITTMSYCFLRKRPSDIDLSMYGTSASTIPSIISLTSMRQLTDSRIRRDFMQLQLNTKGHVGRALCSSVVYFPFESSNEKESLV